MQAGGRSGGHHRGRVRGCRAGADASEGEGGIGAGTGGDQNVGSPGAAVSHRRQCDDASRRRRHRQTSAPCVGLLVEIRRVTVESVPRPITCSRRTVNHKKRRLDIERSGAGARFFARERAFDDSRGESGRTHGVGVSLDPSNRRLACTGEGHATRSTSMGSSISPMTASSASVAVMRPTTVSPGSS